MNKITSPGDDERTSVLGGPRLDSPSIYRVTVPGHLQEPLPDWAAQFDTANGLDENGSAITTFTGTLDQAALIGLLRRLYALGLPLISVRWQPPEAPPTGS